MIFNKKRARLTPPTTPCPDCGGRRVQVDGSVEMILRAPGGLGRVSELGGSACTACGRVFLYAVELEKLQKAFPTDEPAPG